MLRHYTDSGQGRAELARRLGHPRRGAGGEFGGGEAALAVETAEKIVGGLVAFLGVAFHAAGDQVAVGAWQSPGALKPPGSLRFANFKGPAPLYLRWSSPLRTLPLSFLHLPRVSFECHSQGISITSTIA